MIKRVTLVAAAATIAGVALVGCGKQNGETVPPPSLENNPQASEVAKAQAAQQAEMGRRQQQMRLQQQARQGTPR